MVPALTTSTTFTLSTDSHVHCADDNSTHMSADGEGHVGKHQEKQWALLEAQSLSSCLLSQGMLMLALLHTSRSCGLVY